MSIIARIKITWESPYVLFVKQFPSILSLNCKVHSFLKHAVLKINEGAKILTDLSYRLSLSRAQLMLTLNLLAKNTADTLPADDFLFGEAIGKELKKASTLERASKNLVKTPLPVFRKVQQLVK